MSFRKTSGQKKQNIQALLDLITHENVIVYTFKKEMW